MLSFIFSVKHALVIPCITMNVQFDSNLESVVQMSNLNHAVRNVKADIIYYYV